MEGTGSKLRYSFLPGRYAGCPEKANKAIWIVLALSGIFCLTSLHAQQDTITTVRPFTEIADSLEARERFIRDSLMAREQFVRDSIMRRKRMLDSLTFLQRELQDLLYAYAGTVTEDIILRDYNIEIIGDSVLGDYSFLILPFSVSQPFTPWKVSYRLTGNQVRITTDNQVRRITSIQAPFMKCSFARRNSSSLLVLNGRSVIRKHYSGQFYTTPVDSVFFDRAKRISVIKRYTEVYDITNGNQRGAPLFVNLNLVKQYEYNPDNKIGKVQVVRFCERWKAYEPNKVCSIINYTLSDQGGELFLTRQNDPENKYSDGTFRYAFDNQDNLKGISFQNISKTEGWERTIELNNDGNVHCYFDKVGGVIRQSLCMIYHTDEPDAKYPVETVTTTFEADGISYYQKNNTTGKLRTRDRMTLEWSPWR
jgi:hypothetical protein